MYDTNDFSYQIFFPRNDQVRARKVVKHGNYGHVIKFASIKCGRLVELESLLEYDRAVQLEFNPSVIIFHEQPFRLELTINGSTRNQYPDFLVFYDDGSVVVEEVKPAVKLKDSGIVAKLDAQRQIFRSLGYDFKIMTDEQIRSGHVLANSKRLLPYRRIAVPSMVIEYVGRSLACSAKMGKEIVKEAFGATEELILALLSQGVVETDFSVPINMSSLFKVNVRRSMLTEKQNLVLRRTCI